MIREKNRLAPSPYRKRAYHCIQTKGDNPMPLGYPSAGAKAKAVDYFEHNGSLHDEFYWISEINKASLVMNTEEGLLSRDNAKAFARGLEETIKEGDQPGNPRPKMYIRYEPLMIKHCGISCTLLHAGRSSQDMHSTFFRMGMREKLLNFMKAALAARKALYRLAWENRDTVAPNYTNGVAAQPNSLGHEWLGHVQSFERDFRTMKAVYAETNQSPMGTTVLNGTSWPLNRHRMAELLGFDGVIDNAFDAGQISAEDMFIQTAQSVVLPMLHIGHFIQDIMTQYAQPRPWILVTSTYVSSAMPQKRNPGPLIDVRRDASEVINESNGSLMRVHNLMPGMYDGKDLPLGRQLFDDAVTVMDNFTEVVGMLKVNAERALEELNSDWTASQEVADILMHRFNVPFRVGHHFASAMVTYARTHELTPLTFPYAKACELWTEEVKKEAEGIASETFPLDEQGFKEALNPVAIIANRRVYGGPQPSEMKRQFEERQAGIDADEAWLNETLGRLEKAQQNRQSLYEALMK